MTEESTSEYGLVIDHDCDEDLIFRIVNRSMLGKHAASVHLTEEEVSDFHRIQDSWRHWQEVFAKAYYAHADERTCQSCNGSGVVQEHNDT